MDDAELVERALAGDQAAFGELIDRHRFAVYRAALAALGSPADAEEAAQDAFLSAHRHLNRFRGQSTVKWRVAEARRLLKERLARLGYQRDGRP